MRSMLSHLIIILRSCKIYDHNIKVDLSCLAQKLASLAQKLASLAQKLASLAIHVWMGTYSGGSRWVSEVLTEALI